MKHLAVFFAATIFAVAGVRAAVLPRSLVGIYAGNSAKVEGKADMTITIHISEKGRVTIRYTVYGMDRVPSDDYRPFTRAFLGHLVRPRAIKRGGKTFVTAKLRTLDSRKADPLVVQANIRAQVRGGKVQGFSGEIREGKRSGPMAGQRYNTFVVERR